METALETSWPSASAVERASTEADVCCIESDTRRLSTSSRSVSRYDGAIGRSSSVFFFLLIRLMFEADADVCMLTVDNEDSPFL